MSKLPFKIEKNVPVPPSRSLWKQMFSAMAVGDSFICPLANCAQTSINTAASRMKIKVITRKISDTELRVWRVE